MINQNFVYLGVLLQFVGGVGYLIDTVQGKAKPNRVSWILWSAAPLIAFYAQIRQGVGVEAFATFIVGFTPLLIFIASFTNKKAVWRISTLDIVCGFCSLIGLLLWFLTKSGNIAILFSIFADGFACIPTMVKSWYAPETESDSIFLMGVVNAAIGLLVIKNWHFANCAFLIYLFFADFILVLLVRFKIGHLFVKQTTSKR